MKRGMPDESTSVDRLAALSVTTAVGAIAVYALVRYMLSRTDGKIALGTASAAIDLETWLKQTATSLQRGAQSMINRVDKR